MIEINECDISTSFDKGFINQYISIYNGVVKLGTYYAAPANNIIHASINRDELLKHIEGDLQGKYEVKINLSI
jgi:hypothetical protein